MMDLKGIWSCEKKEDAVVNLIASLRQISEVLSRSASVMFLPVMHNVAARREVLRQKKGSLTTSAMRQMIDVLVRDTTARKLVPAQTSAHTLRHTFARNYLAEHPGDIVGLASILGHTSLDTTRIYSQPTIEQLSPRVEQLSQNAYTS
jgi:site-specific recombinase XerD